MNPSLITDHSSLTPDVVLRVQGVSKKFCRNLKRSMLYGMQDLGRSLLGIRPVANSNSSKTINTEVGGLRKDEFWALRNINFDLRRGETIGIVGSNGSGKTTLLRMLSGIFPPNEGTIALKGRLGALIALGAGMHPHMTGRENIYLNGTTIGMRRHEIDRKFEAIVDFADIGDFLDAPVSTYSSGMAVRLGFSVAINSDINILLADEVLAVGDVGFMLKCFNKIGELRKKGVATLFVSHDLHSISTFADRVVLLHKGRQEFCGATAEGLTLYKRHFENFFASEGEIEKVTSGADGFEIVGVEFDPPLLNGKIVCLNQSDLNYTIHYRASKEFPDVEVDTVMYIPMPGPHFFQASNRAFGKRIDLRVGTGRLHVNVNRLSVNNMNGHLCITIWAAGRSSVLFWWRRIPVTFQGISLSTGWSHFNIQYNAK